MCLGLWVLKVISEFSPSERDQARNLSDHIIARSFFFIHSGLTISRQPGLIHCTKTLFFSTDSFLARVILKPVNEQFHRVCVTWVERCRTKLTSLYGPWWSIHSINLTQLKEINTLVKHSAVREKNPLVTHYKRPINFPRFTKGELCLLIMLSRFESMYIHYFSGITHLIILFQWPSGADLGGGCNSRTPPPLPEMTCGFLIQLVFCKKKNHVVYWCWSKARDECTPS